jgi:hypothetical protein
LYRYLSLLVLHHLDIKYPVGRDAVPSHRNVLLPSEVTDALHLLNPDLPEDAGLTCADKEAVQSSQTAMAKSVFFIFMR